MKCSSEYFAGCDSRVEVVPKMLVQSYVFEASTLGTTSALRITQKNIPRTETNAHLPFRFIAVNLNYPDTSSAFIFRVLRNTVTYVPKLPFG